MQLTDPAPPPENDAASTVAAPRPAVADPGPFTRRWKFGWILEAAMIAGVGYVYETYRNAVMGRAGAALRNAKTLTHIEVWLGIYHERAVQHFFLNWPFVVALWNTYYDTAHFLVPAAAAFYLYFKFPARYVFWRNVFFFLLLGVGQLVWWAFPVNPPKYMPASYGFVDTQVKYWNVGPQKGIAYGKDGQPTKAVVESVGNLYGGMPSHHISWALWVLCALWPVVKRWWVKGLLILHLLLTLGAVTVTGNHRWIDAAGSVVEVAIAYGLARLLQAYLRHRRERRAATAALVTA
jgi:hypothetical protein